MDTKDIETYNDREMNLIQELHKKGCTHTEIAKCVQRERTIFKLGKMEIGDCLIKVEETLLNLYRRRV